MQGYSDVFFLRIILKRTSTEAQVYILRHQGATVKHFDVSNVIYHKFSHGAVSCTLNGENGNVMLEKRLFYVYNWTYFKTCLTVKVQTFQWPLQTITLTSIEL